MKYDPDNARPDGLIEQLLESIEAAVFLFESDGVVTANQFACQVLNSTPDKLKGQPIPDLLQSYRPITMTALQNDTPAVLNNEYAVMWSVQELRLPGRDMYMGIARVTTNERGQPGLMVTGDGLWDLHLPLDMLFFSPVWETMLGYRPGDLRHEVIFWRNMIHPDDVDRVQERFYAHLEGRSVDYRAEYRMRARNGHWVWVQDRGQVVDRDATGQPLRIVGVHTDISARREVERSLREQEALLNSVLDSSPAGVMAFKALRDESGAIMDFVWQLVNRSAEEMVGFSREYLVGRRLLEVMPGNARDGLFNLYKHVVEEGETLIREHHYSHENVDSWLRIIAVKLFDGFAVTFSDITAERQAAETVMEQERLRFSLEKESELGRLRDQLMSTISHEFRTPLAVILSSSEMLRTYSTRLSEHQRETYFERIRLQVDHMTAVINDLGLLVRGISQRNLAGALRFDIVTLLRGAVQEAQAGRGQRHHLVITGIEEPVAVRGDQELLQGMISHLLYNAVKYSEAGSTITVDIAVNGEQLVLRVQDEGAGVAPEDQQRIFEPFVRVGDTDAFGGTGLGLTIVRDAVALHQGTVELKSTPGEGTTFIVSLPILA